MKVKFVGETFGAVSLTDGVIYECIGVEDCGGEVLALRIIDDEGLPYWEKEDDEPDGYLYSAKNPSPFDGSSMGGHWEIIEDNENGTLAKAIGV
jgi:hypothetical protein